LNFKETGDQFHSQEIILKDCSIDSKSTIEFNAQCLFGHLSVKKLLDFSQEVDLRFPFEINHT